MRHLVAACGAALLLCAVSATAQTTLRIARIENVPDQQVGGEILTAVYARLGIRIEFVAAPAKRALIESSQGRLDGEVQRVLDVQNEYPTLLPVRESIDYIEPSVFTTRTDIKVDGWASIAPYAVGIVRGVGSSERGTKGMPHVEAATTMEQLMEMAASARVDVAVNDRFSGLLVTRRLGLDKKVRPLAPPLQHIELYHFLNERHRDLVPRVEAVIREMKSSGELERLRTQISERMIEEARK